MEIAMIHTEEDFDKFVEELEAKMLPNDEEYALYNQAFEQLYHHPPFDEDGYFWSRS